MCSSGFHRQDDSNKCGRKKMEPTAVNSVVNGNHYQELHQGRLNMYKSKVDVVLGAQWGDEGKGKVVDMLALDVDIVCRCQVSLF